MDSSKLENISALTPVIGVQFFDPGQGCEIDLGLTSLRNGPRQENRMSHTPHELAEEFPDKVELISELKQSNAHFAGLVDKYHEINRAIHRAETNVEPTEELHEVEMRKERMMLKDDIWKMLSA